MSADFIKAKVFYTKITFKINIISSVHFLISFFVFIIIIGNNTNQMLN